jgi:hypothetical protein
MKKEEKAILSDIDDTFKILDRDRDKHRNIWNERKLRQDELKDSKLKIIESKKITERLW